MENNNIYDFLGATKINNIPDLNCHIGKYAQTIPKELEEYLYNVYKPHNDKLYKWLGRKIDIWENYYEKL